MKALRYEKGSRARPSAGSYRALKKYHALDTETPLGWLKVIATEEEALEVETFEDVLAFLNQRKFRGAIFFTFNLGFDAEAIIKLTGDMEFLKKLYFEGADPKGIPYFPKESTDRPKVRIRYIPTKFLRICFQWNEKSSNCVSFYDISQFFGGWSLDKVSRKYLGDYKNPVSGKQIGQEEGYYEKHKFEVMEYCKKDANLTLRAAELMRNTIESVRMPKGSLTFRNPISQAKISEMYIKDNYKYPKIPEPVEIFHWLAEQSYHGGRFETLKRGMFDQTLYSYDINSAYPTEMYKLPHWGNGRFVKVDKPNEVDTKYGWFLCKFDCPFISYPDYSHPYEVEFCYNDVNPTHCENVLMNPKRVVYPIGTRRQWVTKMEYEWMVKYGYECKMMGGVAWEEMKEEYESPFSWVKEVYYARRAIKEADSEDIQQWALKIAMNGAYGKTAQKKKGRGALTNFFYASYITAGTRKQISEAMKNGYEKLIYGNPNVIEIATDSILSTTPLNLPISNKLGEWSVNKYKKGLIIGSGIRQQWLSSSSITPTSDNDSPIANKPHTGESTGNSEYEGEAFITHARGLTYKSDWDMLEAIERGYNDREHKPNVNCDYLFFEKERPIHLGEIIFHHKILSLKDLGVFTKVSKRLSVNTDKKRRWEREYKDFEDMLESAPQTSEPLVLGEDV